MRSVHVYSGEQEPAPSERRRRNEQRKDAQRGLQQQDEPAESDERHARNQGLVERTTRLRVTV